MIDGRWFNEKKKRKISYMCNAQKKNVERIPILYIFSSTKTFFKYTHTYTLKYLYEEKLLLLSFQLDPRRAISSDPLCNLYYMICEVKVYVCVWHNNDLQDI